MSQTATGRMGKEKYDNDADTARAVSYTHLDVYKRQTGSFLTGIIAPVRTSFYGWHRLFWAGRQEIDRRRKARAVTYTHLETTAEPGIHHGDAAFGTDTG